MDMTKPTFLFVPGAWHTPAVFNPITTLLNDHGYITEGLSLPSVGVFPGIPDFTADVVALQNLINKHLDLGSDIIVVLWSYGSVVGTEAVLPEMRRSARQAKEKAGGVLHLVFLAAPILPVGMSVFKSDPSPPPPEVMEKLVDQDFENGTITIKPDFAAQLFYNDVEDKEHVKELVAGMKSMSLGPMASELTRASWEYTPCSLIMCEQDFGLPLERLKKQLAAARERCPGAFGKVQRLNAGHSPFVSMPGKVVDFLKSVADELE